MIVNSKFFILLGNPSLNRLHFLPFSKEKANTFPKILSKAGHKAVILALTRAPLPMVSPKWHLLPLDPLVLVRGTEGDASKQLRSIEIHGKLIPEGPKRVSILQKQRQLFIHCDRHRVRQARGANEGAVLGNPKVPP